MTRGINAELERSSDFAKEVTNSIARYNSKDWGDLCESDKELNSQAIEGGGRILASYKTCKGKVYIITDDTKAKEQITTVLFANEY